MQKWENMLSKLLSPKKTVQIGVVGKYVMHSDAYKSVFEALLHGGIPSQTKVEIVPIDSEDLEKSVSPSKILAKLLECDTDL